MSFLKRWFGGGIDLPPELLDRLAAWRALADPATDQPFDASRFVVVDVESTGLDLNKDRLIAIGAVAFVNGRIDLADSFEVVLRQDKVSDKDNILIHGIGGEAQRDGAPPAEGLLDFLGYLGKSPLVAFHVTFDETMIRRAMKDYLGFDFKHAWLDLAYVMPGLLPDYARKYKALDHWSNHFQIANYARHSALADALATAQLFLCALPLARERKSAHYKSLQELEKAQRWVSWGN